MQFHQPHFAIEVEAELTQHHVVRFREKRADQFPAVRAGNAELLSAQIVLLFAGVFRLDCNNLWGKRIVFVPHVQLRWILQVHFKN